MARHVNSYSHTIAAACVISVLSLGPCLLEAAVGCTLTNPAQDLKYLFPEMTTYKEELRELNRLKDGKSLYQALKQRLGSDLDPVYESYETPYTLYIVFKGKVVIGIAHGVNVPGQGGLIQIFVSTEPQTGVIRQVFFQRLESVASRALRSKDFVGQFKGLTLADFYSHDFFTVLDPRSPKDKIAQIKSPVADGRGREDYEASVRGVRKNLILLDIFVYERRFEPIYQHVREALSKAKDARRKGDSR